MFSEVTEVRDGIHLLTARAANEQVAADLAPIAIAGGYEISFHKDADSIMAWGDRSALERAMVNLVQNAIQHGGRRGAIEIAARLPAGMEVCDEGPGICVDALASVIGE